MSITAVTNPNINIGVNMKSNSQDLAIELRKYLNENRHSLSDEDVKLLRRCIIQLEGINSSQINLADLTVGVAKICEVAIRLFSEN